jgi:alkanesulfonate monooxygenase SsuD/methylene tetrahydromethanopterin reductase-like flavin-dependent oxidoreductase (luciferase family)
MGDQHSTGPTSYVQNVPMLGRLLAEWDERPAGSLFLVPLWHPVVMAENIGTLASIAGGTFLVQIALGTGERQFKAMGVSFADRVRLLESGVSTVSRLLQGEEVDDEAWGVSGARIAPLPPGDVEWWVSADPADIDLAARLGDCWYGNPDLTPSQAAHSIESYRDAASRYGRTPTRFPIRKDVFIAETAARAEAVGEALIAGGYRGVERSAVAYGDPAGVAEQLAPLAELGFTDVILRTMPAPEAEAELSAELAGQVRELLLNV